MTTAQTTRTDNGYARALGRIVDLVAELNELLGLTDTEAPRVTFGYIGNVAGIPDTPAYRDDRAWSVFLPHPGRVGTAEDRIGSFATGDAAGAFTAVRELAAFAKGVRVGKAAR